MDVMIVGDNLPLVSRYVNRSPFGVENEDSAVIRAEEIVEDEERE
jgi:hypothetical protein